MVRRVVLRVFHNTRPSLCLENAHEAYNPECLVPTVKHGDGYVMTWAAVSWYSAGPIITLNGRITASDYTLGN
jgi:hypothetical protein